MMIVTEHAFTLDQLVALVHGDLDLSSIALVTREISEEEAAIRAFLDDEDTCRITAEDLDQMITLD